MGPAFEGVRRREDGPMVVPNYSGQLLISLVEFDGKCRQPLISRPNLCRAAKKR